jgi:hypothetical protein
MCFLELGLPRLVNKYKPRFISERLGTYVKLRPTTPKRLNQKCPNLDYFSAYTSIFELKVITFWVYCRYLVVQNIGLDQCAAMCMQTYPGVSSAAPIKAWSFS